MNLRDLFGDGDERPPAPEVATAEDVERYNLQFAKESGMVPDFESQQATSGDPTESPFAKQDDSDEVARNAKHRARFPWLSDPSHGARWDFDPIALRNLAQTNTWVGMLVQSITKEIAETPWTIVEADGRVETQKRLQTLPEERTPIAKADGVSELPDANAERIHELLMRPNPDLTWQDMVEMWMGDLLEIGSTATVKAFHRSAYGDGDDGSEELTADPSSVAPRALQPSAPEVWTKEFSNRTGLIEGYWQFDDHRAPGSGTTEDATTRARGGGSPDKFAPAEMVWSDMTPRTNRRYGIPPTLLVEDFLQSLDLAVVQEQQYLSRGSIPSGAWVFEQWDRKQLQERRQEMEENVKGKPHKSLMFAGQGGDVSFEPMSMNFEELQFTERMKWYARVVASAFQVPTAVVGIEPERVNYNTFQGERENFESNTLGPYLQKLERMINHELIHPHWGVGSYRFEFKPGMSESTRAMISERVTREFNAGIRRRNEARREIGLDEVDEPEDGFKSEVTNGDDGGQLFDDVMASRQAESTPTSGGSGNANRVVVVKQEIPDDAYTIDDPSECGGSVIEGPQGGTYCVPDGDSDDRPASLAPEETLQEVTSIVEDGSLSDLESHIAETAGVESVTLPDIDDAEQQARLASALAHAGKTGLTENVDEIDTRTGEEFGMYMFNDNRLEINADVDESELEGQADDGFAVGDDLEWLVLHELGHANHAAELDNDVERAKELLDHGMSVSADGEFVGRERMDLVDEEVSSYGRTSAGEFVAEVFSGLALGKEFDDEIMEIYAEFGGPETWQDYRGGGS